MHIAQLPYRELYDEIPSHEGETLYEQVLKPWIAANPLEKEWLASFAARVGNPVPPVEPEDLWRLYALGRVFDLLLLGFQRGQADGSSWPGPTISPDEYIAFAEGLGFVVTNGQSCSPFYHEIVEVEPAPEAGQPITVRAEIWPCLMLGDMMFSRAGVRVSGGRQHVSKEIAENSTLYWTHRRKNRRTEDLAVGWGSNSQWRTDFRRDYRIGHDFFYNVDGAQNVMEPDPMAAEPEELTTEERAELLINRCFIVTEKPDGDLFPYDYMLRPDI